MGFAWASTSAYAFIILLALMLIYHLLCLIEPICIMFIIYCETYVEVIYCVRLFMVIETLWYYGFHILELWNSIWLESLLKDDMNSSTG